MSCSHAAFAISMLLNVSKTVGWQFPRVPDENVMPGIGTLRAWPQPFAVAEGTVISPLSAQGARAPLPHIVIWDRGAPFPVIEVAQQFGFPPGRSPQPRPPQVPHEAGQHTVGGEPLRSEPSERPFRMPPALLQSSCAWWTQSCFKSLIQPSFVNPLLQVTVVREAVRRGGGGGGRRAPGHAPGYFSAAHLLSSVTP
jgi:hypothetical protein